MLANGVTVPVQPMCGDLWNTDPPKPRGHLCDHYHNHIKAAGDYHRGLRGETLSVRRVGYEPCLQGAPIIGGGGGFLCKRANTKNIPSFLKKERKKDPSYFYGCTLTSHTTPVINPNTSITSGQIVKTRQISPPHSKCPQDWLFPLRRKMLPEVKNFSN